MVKHGARPTKIDHRDYDFKKSFGALKTVPFPPEYNTDAGLTMPNQDLVNNDFTPPVPALDYGCTDYTTSEVATDLLQPINLYSAKNPLVIESITHANANGGGDVRQSLMAGVSVGWYSGIFNIQAYGQDFFDAIRDAMASGGTERRSVSIGTPWFSVFEEVDSSGILQIPRSFNTAGLPWHNFKICGWKTIGGQVYLKAKSWQGPTYGDHGYCYFSRQLINNVMSIKYTAAFTATRGVLPPIQTIDTTWLQWLLSWGRSLLPY